MNITTWKKVRTKGYLDEKERPKRVFKWKRKTLKGKKKKKERPKRVFKWKRKTRKGKNDKNQGKARDNRSWNYSKKKSSWLKKT
jgi:hypothetical protein